MTAPNTSPLLGVSYAGCLGTLRELLGRHSPELPSRMMHYLAKYYGLVEVALAFLFPVGQAEQMPGYRQQQRQDRAEAARMLAAAA